MSCNYYEYRLHEIREQLLLLKSRPDQVEDVIRELEEEQSRILKELRVSGDRDGN